VTNGVVQLVSQGGAEFGTPRVGFGGTFHGGACAPRPCGTTAAESSEERASWGEVKARYR
jgi:hypothetical protein